MIVVIIIIIHIVDLVCENIMKSTMMLVECFVLINAITIFLIHKILFFTINSMTIQTEVIRMLKKL
jgi:hypothetical protein